MNEWVNKGVSSWMTERMLQAVLDWRFTGDLVLPGLHEIRSKSDFCSKKNKSLQKKRERRKAIWKFFSDSWGNGSFQEERKGGKRIWDCLLWKISLEGWHPGNAHILFLLKVNLSIWTSGFISGGFSAFKSGTEATATPADIDWRHQWYYSSS